MSFLTSDLIKECSGLFPQTWLVVGRGFSREEIKAEFLKEGFGFSGASLHSLQSLCETILGVDRERILDSSSRQEVLRVILSQRNISSRCPELKRLRRQRGFFQRLDRSIQSALLTFKHDEEFQVYNEKLRERFGENLLRNEIMYIIPAYLEWMRSSSFYDLPLLMRLSIEKLENHSIEFDEFPKKMVVLRAETTESLEASLFDALSRECAIQVEELKYESDVRKEYESRRNSSLKIDVWHSLDDAAQDLADRLVAETKQGRSLEEQSILIPDFPAVRRSVMRALSENKIELFDPRDPTQVRVGEEYKKALLPLMLAAGRFDRARVVSFIRLSQFQETEKFSFIKEISQRAVRNGIQNYQGGKLEGLAQALNDIHEKFSPRLSFSEISKRHLEIIDTNLQPFFKAIWDKIGLDLAIVGSLKKKFPVLLWLERLQMRIEVAKPPAEKSQWSKGVRLSKLGQAPSRPFEKLWVLGIPSNYFEGERLSDYVFSDREKESLSFEFQVRSSLQTAEERMKNFGAWLTHSKSLEVLDYQFDWNGSEREEPKLAFEVLGYDADHIEVVKRGAKARWADCYHPSELLQPQKISLPWHNQSEPKPEISATDLENYTRCPFQALARSRWKLNDLDEPDAELWPNVRGNILHMAAKIWVETRNADGSFSLSTEDVLEQAWNKNPPIGLFKSLKVQEVAKKRLVKVLEKFKEKELEYVSRSKTKVFSLEGPELKKEFSVAHVKGRPDRIDLYGDSLFLIDYKTSSSANIPSGQEMVELGYRLQIPFYVLAMQDQLNKNVAGANFISLSSDASRAKGILFKATNGKNDGDLTNSKGRTSLFDQEPVKVFEKCEEQIELALTQYLNGEFNPIPKKSSECKGCFANTLCGRARAGEGEESEGEA